MTLSNKEGTTLHIKFNPEITGFKRVFQEQIVNTLGGTYPIAMRNANLNYRQFSIGGLLSYHESDYTFLTKEDRENIDKLYSTEMDKEIAYEKAYRDAVLDFLYANDIKLFQSETEGSMYVRLSNISLTPNKTLGRRIYSFTAQATEMPPWETQEA